MPDPLPTIPVPLRSPDADVPFDLGEAIAAVKAAYELSIDYRQSPPPTLSEGDRDGVDHLLSDCNLELFGR